MTCNEENNETSMWNCKIVLHFRFNVFDQIDQQIDKKSIKIVN